MERVILLCIGLLLMLGSLLSCGKIIDSSKSSAYHLKKGLVYYIPGGNSFERGAQKMDADPTSFKPIAESYGKDKSSVYFRGTRQDGIDVESFAIENGIPKDKKYVYYYDGKDIGFNRNGDDVLSVVDQADPLTFRKLDKPYLIFAVDKQHYYYKGRRLDVDYESFQFLNRHFMKDVNSLYLDNGELLVVADSSFQKAEKISNEYILVDGRKLLYFQSLKGVGIISTRLPKESFPLQAVDDDILKTRIAVFAFGRPIPNADPESLHILFKTKTELISKDKNYVFYNFDRILEADAASYQWLNGWVGKDSRFVYYKNQKIVVPDIKGFRKAESSGKRGVAFEDSQGNAYDYKCDKMT